MRALSLMGLDGAVVGNHEFDLGSRNLFEQIDNWAQFPLLAANYLFEDPLNPGERSLRDVVEPYAIYDVDGLKVGVIGMGNWSSMTGIFEGGNSLGVRPLVDGQVVEEYVRLLRPVVDVVVLVSHLGLDEDEGLAATEIEVDQNEALPLAGVDLVLGGHLHIVLNPPKSIPNDDVRQPDRAGPLRRVRQVRRPARPGGQGRRGQQRPAAPQQDHRRTRSRPSRSTRTVEDDAEVAELLWPYSVALNREIDLNGVLAYVDTPGDEKVVRADPTGGDSQLGNLVARAMQLRTGIEAEIRHHQLARHPRRLREGPAHRRADVQRVPVRELDHRSSTCRGIRDPGDARLRGAQVGRARLPQPGPGLRHHLRHGVHADECPDGAARRAPRTSPWATTAAAATPTARSTRSAARRSCRPACTRWRSTTTSRAAAPASTCSSATPRSSSPASRCATRWSTTCASSAPAARTSIDISDPDRATVRERWGAIACIDSSVEPHDGRIRPVFE